MQLEYAFSSEKNHLLKETRGISFEEIISAIENGQLLDITEHPNQGKYPNQKIYVISIQDYVVLVPFVREGNILFLKTIIPSRQATKKYLGGGR